MSDLAERFKLEYGRALRDRLATGGEEELAAAHDLGRWAMSHGLGLLDVVEAHHNVTTELPPTGVHGVPADQFLLQSLAAFEMAQRGFWEAQERIKVEEALVAGLQAVTAGSIAIMGRVTSGQRLAEFLQQARAVVGASDAALESYGENPEFCSTAPGPLDEGLHRIMRRVAASGQPVRIDGPVTGNQVAASPPVLCVPLVVDQGQTRGALLAWGQRRFEASDEAALQQLATMGTIAWSNALVFEREHEISLTLQQSLLPEAIPDISGLDIAARYVPSGPGSQVGGDWYDVIELGRGQIGFVVGDVMGHGIKAASVMGQLRLALRAYAVDGHGPAQVIDRVDRLLESLDGGQYATIVYVVLDPGSGQVEIVDAGHPPPLLLKSSGEAEFLTPRSSPPLGVRLGGPSHREHRLVISRGSTLLLYTDGLIESRNRTIDEGMAALKTVAANFNGSPDHFCDLILTTVADATLQDDVCLLVVHLD